MGVINYTTAKINELLDKIDKAPEKIENGKTPVFVTGTTTTLDPGLSATAEVVQDGVDENGNPKYKINFGVPKGLDGASGGGGGTADSVQWSNILNMPSWVNSATKPTYTASEVGALPSDTTIPTKTSQLTNDSKFLTSIDFKTINGQSIVGSGNISISGTGGIKEAPKDGETYGRNNGLWVKTSQMEEAPTDDKVYARKNKGWTTVLEKTETALLENYLKPDSYTAIEPTDSINSAIGKLEAGLNNQSGEDSSNDEFYLPKDVYELKAGSTREEITAAFGGDDGVKALEDAMSNKKKIYIIINDSFLKSVIPVSYDVAFNTLWGISFKRKIQASVDNATGTIRITPSRVYLLYDGGYVLNSSFYNLTSSSSSEEISISLGGEEGMKNLIQAINDGNRVCILNDAETGGKTDILCNAAKIEEGGNMTCIFFGMGYSLWVISIGMIYISYDKNSNTFQASTTSIGS